MENSPPFDICILPRKSMDWNDFIQNTPSQSIALDGVVRGGPRFDPETLHVNFDHHDCVVREATMSSAMQVYFAIKGGLMDSFGSNQKANRVCVYINDTDQDTSFAVWLLLNYKLFEGLQSIPHVNRLLALTDRWDITGGAFPMNLDDTIVRQHNWVFRPYSDLRKSGALAQANAEVLRDNLEAVMGRLSRLMMGKSEEIALDTQHVLLFDSPTYKIVDETGGNEARYHLFSKGMTAFISRVATRDDGRFVYSVGRSSQFVRFPVEKLYDDYNLAEGFNRQNGFNGSTIVGGSSREFGSGLSWEMMRDITNKRLQLEGIPF